jgi:hypothetical protein
MAEKQKSSAMIPVIIAGACLFGFGIFQSTRPKEPEVNTGFVAPPQTPTPPTGNPRTMQAPDAPAMEKDAAQRAAESDTTTKIDVKFNNGAEKLSTTNAPWLQGIMSGTTGNFRDGVLTSLKGEQAKGNLNCAPVLTDMAQSAFGGVEKIACTAKDGGQIDGDFGNSGDGDLKVEYPDGGMVKVSKNDGDFNVETRVSQ